MLTKGAHDLGGLAKLQLALAPVAAELANLQRLQGEFCGVEQDPSVEWVVEAVNNLPKDLSSGLSGLLGTVLTDTTVKKPEPPYQNRFTCLRRGIPILPEEIAPPIPGLLTALVVGPGKAEVHTDDLGRIKIRFLFTRALEHAETGASESDADSDWVRQSELGPESMKFSG